MDVPPIRKKGKNRHPYAEDKKTGRRNAPAGVKRRLLPSMIQDTPGRAKARRQCP